MSVPAPHYVLYSSARQVRPPHEPGAGHWQFVLEAVDGSAKLAASDDENELSRDRLELWAIVRGLEALDQPSVVTIVTASRYILRGLRFGLANWRENGWQWERFGQYVPVKNADLWKRIDDALRFHRVTTKAIDPPGATQVQWHRADGAHATSAATKPTRNAAPRRGWRQRLAGLLDAWSDHLMRAASRVARSASPTPTS